MSRSTYDANRPIKITCGPQGNQLADLSPELHLLILSHLEPFDVLSIRKTSRALFSASNERRLWVEMLRHLCQERDAYLPTYDVSSMSLQELERVTCNPKLLERQLLRDNPDGTDHIEATLSSIILDDTPSTDANPLQNVFFVPGGRFLLGFSPKRIQIWDLIDSSQPRRISSMDLTRTGRIMNTDVHCPASGSNIYLFAQLSVVAGTKYANQGYETALMVLELDLVNRRRLSRRIVGLRRGLVHINIAAEFLLALDYTRPSGEERFWGWDLSQHHFAKFTLGGRQGLGDPSGNWDLLIQGENLVLYEFHTRAPVSCTVTVYPLPLFRQRSELALQKLEPLSKMDFILPVNTVYAEFLLWCSFHCRQQLPGAVDTIITTRRIAESTDPDNAVVLAETKTLAYRMLTAQKSPIDISTSPENEGSSSSEMTSTQPKLGEVEHTPVSSQSTGSAEKALTSPSLHQSYELTSQGSSSLRTSYQANRAQILVPTSRTLQFSHVDETDEALRIHTVLYNKDRTDPAGVEPVKSSSRRLIYRHLDGSPGLVTVGDRCDYHLDIFSGRVAVIKEHQGGKRDLQIFDFFPRGQTTRTYAVIHSGTQVDNSPTNGAYVPIGPVLPV